MKAYVMQVLVVDHWDAGPAELGAALQLGEMDDPEKNPRMLQFDRYEIGDWSDDHPLHPLKWRWWEYLKTLEPETMK